MKTVKHGCKFMGGKKVKVAVGVDDHLENIFVSICKPDK